MADQAPGVAPTATNDPRLPPPGVHTDSPSGNGGAEQPSSSITSLDNLPAETTPTQSLSQNFPAPSSSPAVLPPAPAPSVITFNNAANFGPNITGRVFYADNQTKTLSWSYDSTKTTLIDIFWYGRDNDNEPFNTSQAQVIASAEFDGPRSPEFITVNHLNTVLNLTAPNVVDWYEKEMVVKIEWVTQEEVQGFSQSGVFTVAQRGAQNFTAESFGREVGKFDQDKSGFQQVTSNNSGPGNLPNPNPTSVSSGGISSGHSGLSKGAIAGIAVACSVVGIALIGALVWFLLRRRRRHFDEGYKATRQTTRSFIASKEARPSGVESPIVSPFSDDGEARGFSISAIAVPLPLETTATRTSTTGPASTHDGSRADRPDTAASGNMSRNIAHLVEEGMTEADILRLEEEERHLDAEIERATRRTSS